MAKPPEYALEAAKDVTAHLVDTERLDFGNLEQQDRLAYVIADKTVDPADMARLLELCRELVNTARPLASHIGALRSIDRITELEEQMLAIAAAEPEGATP